MDRDHFEARSQENRPQKEAAVVPRGNLSVSYGGV